MFEIPLCPRSPEAFHDSLPLPGSHLSLLLGLYLNSSHIFNVSDDNYSPALLRAGEGFSSVLVLGDQMFYRICISFHLRNWKAPLLTLKCLPVKNKKKKNRLLELVLCQHGYAGIVFPRILFSVWFLPELARRGICESFEGELMRWPLPSSGCLVMARGREKPACLCSPCSMASSFSRPQPCWMTGPQSPPPGTDAPTLCNFCPEDGTTWLVMVSSNLPTSSRVLEAEQWLFSDLSMLPSDFYFSRFANYSWLLRPLINSHCVILMILCYSGWTCNNICTCSIISKKGKSSLRIYVHEKRTRLQVSKQTWRLVRILDKLQK